MKTRSIVSSDGNEIGSWCRSILVFLSYYLYFSFADVSSVLKKHESLLSPDLSAYSIWLAIYASQFAFVCYQLFNKDARRNSLVNRKLIVPFILHQILFTAWLKFYEAEWIFLSAGIYTGLWIMSFICYLLITSEFRNGDDFDGYKVQSWLMIEVPFALLLGWETFTLLVNWNSVVVMLGTLTGAVTPAYELAAFIISLLLIVQAAILFAGLSILMNPFLHIGLTWGCGFTAQRLLNDNDVIKPSSPHLAAVPKAAGLSVAFAGCLAAFYLLVSLSILLQSRFCIPEDEGDEEDSSTLVRNSPPVPLGICESRSKYDPPPSAPACVIPISLRGTADFQAARRLNNMSLPPPSTRVVC